MSRPLSTDAIVAVLDLTADALERARELAGVTAAYREAYTCERAAKLEVAEQRLREALARLDDEGAALLAG